MHTCTLRVSLEYCDFCYQQLFGGIVCINKSFSMPNASQTLNKETFVLSIQSMSTRFINNSN